MSAPRYLFVVKDAESKSFSRSEGDERRLIRRHVSISSIHRKRSSPGQSSDDGQHLPFIQVTPKSNKVRSSRRPLIKPNNSSATLAPPSLTGMACSCHEAPKKLCPLHAIVQMPTKEEHVIDPFASTAIGIDRKAHSLLQYFIYVSHPRTWHAEIQEDASYTFQRDAVTLVRGCLELDVHYYTLLASMASQMQNFDHIDQAEHHSTDLLIVKAIAAVRRYLNSPRTIDQRLIFDVHQLAVTEFYRFELQAARIHLQAVQALLPWNGGIQSLDPALREWIVIGDGYVAAELHLSKPLFPASTFDPGEPSAYKDTFTTPRTLPVGFREAQRHSLLPPSIQGLIRNMATAMQVLECSLELSTPASKLATTSAASLHWAHLRTTAIRHRLLDLDLEDERDNALRITLVMWLFLAMTVTGRQRTCQVLASRLKTSLQEIPQEAEWAAYADLLLWVLATGAMCSSAADRPWFLATFQRLLKTGDSDQMIRLYPVVSDKNLRAFCERFFYLDNIQQPLVQKLITDLGIVEVAPTV